MKTLTLELSKAQSIYHCATPEFKTILEDSFGKEALIGKITDRIKTYEDVCRALSICPIKSLPFQGCTLTDDQNAVNCFFKVMNICTVLREGWNPDWSNHNQCKYYVWLGDYKAGSGFSISNCVGSPAAAGVGSRLCYPSSELALYAASQFNKEYQDYLLNL